MTVYIVCHEKLDELRNDYTLEDLTAYDRRDKAEIMIREKANVVQTLIRPENIRVDNDTCFAYTLKGISETWYIEPTELR